MIEAVIAEQLGRSHARLGRALEGITEEQACRRPTAQLAPIVWQVGHLAFVEAIFARRGGSSCDLPTRYSDLFKPGTGDHAEYPPLAEAWAAFSEVHRAMLKLATETDPAKPVAFPTNAFSSCGGMLIFACQHRNYHIGKIATLRALLGKPLPNLPPQVAEWFSVQNV